VDKPPKARLSLSLGGHAAVDDQFGPGDEGRLVRGQIQDAGRDVFRLTHAAQGHLGDTLFMDIRVVMMSPGHGRIYESRMDRIGPDVFGGVLDGGGLIEDSHRALGSVVGCRGCAADQPIDRRDVDDGAAAGLPHLGNGGLGAQEHSFHCVLRLRGLSRQNKGRISDKRLTRGNPDSSV